MQLIKKNYKKQFASQSLSGRGFSSYKSQKNKRFGVLRDFWNTLSLEFKAVVLLPLIIYMQYAVHQFSSGQFLGFDLVYLYVTFLFLHTSLGLSISLTIALDVIISLTSYRPLGQLFVEIIPINILLYALKSNFTLSKASTKFVYLCFSLVVANLVFFLVLVMDSQVPSHTMQLFQDQNLIFKMFYFGLLALGMHRLSTLNSNLQSGRHEHKW